MKTRNHHIYTKSIAERDRLVDDYQFIGKSDITVDGLHIIVHALPKTSKKKEKEDAKRRKNVRPKVARGREESEESTPRSPSRTARREQRPKTY